MDGVLADFIGGICEYHGRDNPYVKGQNLGNWSIDKYWKMSPSKFWKDVDSIFWSTLKPTLEATWLVNFCIQQVGLNNLCVLTAPPEFEYSAAVRGKREWLAKHFPNGGRFNMLFGTAKEFCASPNHILIDDADHNVVKFREAGGKAILIPRPWNCLYNSKLSVMEHVLNEWEKLNEGEGSSRGVGEGPENKGWLQGLLSFSR